MVLAYHSYAITIIILMLLAYHPHCNNRHFYSLAIIDRINASMVLAYHPQINIDESTQEFMSKYIIASI